MKKAVVMSVDEFCDFSDTPMGRFYAEESPVAGVNIFDASEKPVLLNYTGPLTLAIGFLKDLADKVEDIETCIKDMDQRVTSVGIYGGKVSIDLTVYPENEYGYKDDYGYEESLDIDLPEDENVYFDDFVEQNWRLFSDLQNEVQKTRDEQVEEREYYDSLCFCPI